MDFEWRVNLGALVARSCVVRGMGLPRAPLARHLRSGGSGCRRYWHWPPMGPWPRRSSGGGPRTRAIGASSSGSDPLQRVKQNFEDRRGTGLNAGTGRDEGPRIAAGSSEKNRGRQLSSPASTSSKLRRMRRSCYHHFELQVTKRVISHDRGTASAPVTQKCRADHREKNRKPSTRFSRSSLSA